MHLNASFHLVCGNGIIVVVSNNNFIELPHGYPSTHILSFPKRRNNASWPKEFKALRHVIGHCGGRVKMKECIHS